MKRTNWLWIIIFIVCIAIVFWQSGTIPQASEQPGLTVSVFDVGQGDAILLTTPNHKHILVDGGPDGTVLTRLGETMRFNEHTIDLMVVSHNHADHITGLNRVFDRYDVQKTWMSGAIHTTNEYLQMLQNIKDKKIPTDIVWAGKQTTIDDVTLTVVHPLVSQEGSRPEDQHDATVVIRADYGSKRILLTGDLNEDHEQSMLDGHQDVRADVLKVPHHGSATGLSPAFLQAVNPSVAVISVGAYNMFGHPAPSILTRLQNSHIPTYRTDKNGTVTIFTDGNKIQVATQH